MARLILFMRIVFMGTPAAAAVSLQRLIDDGHDIAAVYSQPDRPSGRGNKIRNSPVKQLALGMGLTLLQPARIKTAEALEEFRELNADVAVVVAYGRILPDGFLHAFPNGSINVHFSLLPKYRGAAPVNWAIVNGEAVTGVTTMRMDAGLDTGDVLLQRETAIGNDEDSIELMARLAVIGANLLSETLADLSSIAPRPQDHSKASLAPIMKKEDGRFDWSFPADKIARMVRGFQPFPTTFTRLHGKKLTIWKCRAEAGHHADQPGTILSSSREEVKIACGGSSKLAIQELQLEGKKRMAAREFLNGLPLNAGDILA